MRSHHSGSTVPIGVRAPSVHRSSRSFTVPRPTGYWVTVMVPTISGWMVQW